MPDAYLLAKEALINSIKAEMMGMQYENEFRIYNNQPISYIDMNFEKLHEELKEIHDDIIKKYYPEQKI